MPLLKPAKQLNDLTPGDRIRVRHKVTVGLRQWPLEVTGTVREIGPVVTGIHTQRVPQDDLWVRAVLLEKADGELTRITFDNDTEVEVLERRQD